MSESLVRLRPYQDQCVKNTLEALDGGLDPMVVAATGTGKTPSLVTIGRDFAIRTGKKTLFLVHRQELADQIESWLARVDPDHPSAREQGESEVVPGLWENRYVVAMVQSISQERRLKRYNPKDYGIIITDESHHSLDTNKSYQSVFDHFLDGNSSIRRAGFSACWVDSAGKPLGRRCGYNHVSFRMRVREAIRDGWLISVRAKGVTVEGIDWNTPPDLDSLESILEEEEPLHKLARAMVELAGDRQVLAFCSTKKGVRALTAILNRPGYRPGSSRFITDEEGRDPLVRRSVVEDFRKGVFQNMVNCGVFVEGTDFPNVGCIAIARPCQSESLATQIVGRVMRPVDGLLDDPSSWGSAESRLHLIADSAKPFGLILDFNLNVAGRKLCTIEDVLGDEYTPQVRDYAKRLTPPPSGEPEDVLERLDRAQAEWALIQEEITRRACVSAKAVVYRTEEVDLFDPRTQSMAPTPSTPPVGREPPTDKQVWRLVHVLGWSEAKARSISKKSASAIIGKHARQESEKAMNDPIAIPIGGDDAD